MLPSGKVREIWLIGHAPRQFGAYETPGCGLCGVVFAVLQRAVKGCGPARACKSPLSSTCYTQSAPGWPKILLIFCAASLIVLFCPLICAYETRLSLLPIYRNLIVKIALKRFLTLTCLAIMSACGGSGTPTISPVPTVLTVSELQAEAARLGAAYGDILDAGTLTSPASIPVSGSADYGGIIGFAEGTATDNNDPYAAGYIDARVNFATNVMAGTAGSFYKTADKSPISGTLALDGRIDRALAATTGLAASGDLTGSLRGIGGTTYDVDLQLGAGLFQPGANVIAGLVSGTVDINGTPTDAFGVALIEKK
jgi:hypothetical protein